MSEEENENEIEKIATKWKNKRGSLIMALHDIQDSKGYIPWEDALETASLLGVPLARIYEVLTFYNYFKLKAPGKIIISSCQGTACHLKGGLQVLQEFEKELNVKAGESTPDGLFHLQEVRCVGCCGLAPVVIINGKAYGQMKADRVRGILNDWREKASSGEI